MRRAARFLLRNWPLKLGAVLFATVLYSGLVLSQSVRTWTGEVTIEPLRQPTGTTVLSDLEPVTQIRYRAPLDVGVVSPDSFRATVNLAGVTPATDGTSSGVPVDVVAVDSRVQIVDWQPREVQVRLDPVEARQIPVTVDYGSVPEGLRVGPPQTEPMTVSVRGASSRVASTSDVLARVTIDASALNIDREVELIAVDEAGNQVPNVEIEPVRARVRIAVASQLANRTLPVVPQLVGELPAGYRITSITVDPLVVTVSGEEATVTRLESAPTEPIDIAGRTTDLETRIGLAIPGQVSVNGPDEVRVLVAISPVTGTRTYSAGVTLVGARSDLTYSLGASQVNVTLGGPIAQLDALDPTQLVAVARVGELDPGTHTVSVTLSAAGGLQLVEMSPSQTTVQVSATPEPTTLGFMPRGPTVL